ncbi:MAG: histone deacetylase [Flavobacteriaceae bacterium]|nr:histone deacetylase [Flavobacteriaceae bacterium]
MLKYELIPAQLLHEGTCTEAQFFAPAMCSEKIITLTHDIDYYKKLTDQQLSAFEQRVIGFPQSPALIERELTITQGTIDACNFALESGVSLNIAGGTHHAFVDRGEGYCLINDMCVAANYLIHKKIAKKILIIDLDVHQGNGTAKIMENETRVFTFSMHGDNNYPFRKEKSDLDIGLPNGCTGDLYLSILNDTLPALIKQLKPDFAFYLAGVDILETDKLGKLKASLTDCKQRDNIVFTQLKKYKIPVVVALGGGYSPEIKTILEAHCNTFRLAMDLY